MKNMILKFFPFMGRGRWYRFFIESDGADYTLTESTLEGSSISSSYLKLPAGFHILDSKIDVHFTAVSANNTSFVLRSYTDDSQGITIPDKTQFDYMYAYVYAYKES